MADYAAYYLQSEGGRSPVEEFVNGLDPAEAGVFCEGVRSNGRRCSSLAYRHALYATLLAPGGPCGLAQRGRGDL